ncbi:MAG: SGNH/GDSL hydrolase family protein [Parabacteroides gordonii]|nr:SGNH/GDSL hydrolase family protein [Parabacteroides gordonii]
MKNMRKWFVLAMCMLATSSLFSQQNDWAQFGRYAEANKSVETPTRVVFMGNSITDGWWNTDSLFFKNNRYIGRGIGGQTTAQMLVRFRADVIDLQPKAVVILAGTNDIAQNNGYIAPENILGNIISMAELAKANNIDVVLCSILPAYEYGWRKGLEPADKIIALNKMIKEYADRHNLTYVDYHSALKDARNGLPEKYSKDGVHPTMEGYKIMERLISEALKKY